MKNIESQLLNALMDLERAAREGRNANPKPDFQLLFKRIDDLAALLPAETDGDLVHYLKRKSYEKARSWLEGRHAEIVAGRCGH
jgi:hypothetical protein